MNYTFEETDHSAVGPRSVAGINPAAPAIEHAAQTGKVLRITVPTDVPAQRIWRQLKSAARTAGVSVLIRPVNAEQYACQLPDATYLLIQVIERLERKGGRQAAKATPAKSRKR